MSEGEVIPLDNENRTVAERSMFAGALPGFSLEATSPRSEEIERLLGLLPPGTRIYLSSPPHLSHERQIDCAVALRRSGFAPVPHLAARKFPGREALDEYMDRMTVEAGVDHVMLIGGDLARPRGPYAAAIDLLREPSFRRAGLEKIGIAAYPEGHPVIDDATLDAALDAKLALAGELGLKAELVTQFGFDADAILAWHQRLRGRGIEAPVRIGLAGPATPRTLLTFALRCGVDLPLRHANTAVRLLRDASADTLFARLSAAGLTDGADRRVAPHFYSFGGLHRTARWAVRKIGKAGTGAALADPSS